MPTEDVEAHSGWSRSDVWSWGIGAPLAIALALALALGTAPSWAVVDVDGWPSGWNQVPTFIAGCLVVVPAIVVGRMAAVRLAERRWPWPIGPRISTTRRARPIVGLLGGFAGVITATSVQNLGAGEAYPDFSGYVLWIGDLRAVVITSFVPVSLGVIGVIAGFSVGSLLGLILALAWDSRPRRSAGQVLARHWPTAR